ncbi:MAG: hypothetical protein RLZZ26_605 [Candidatus Parcubacteria bacterium]|jgi:Zn-dependent protease
MLGPILSLIILILSIIAHEVAHGYAANSLGDPTARLGGRLTLNPIPHIDLMGSIIVPSLLLYFYSHSGVIFGWAKPVPYNPYNLKNQRWGEAIVAVAGPATNLLLALVFGLLVRFGLSIGFDQTALVFGGLIAFTNLYLGFFNLIPFPPLDGFTALRAALPWRFAAGLARFETQARASGAVTLIFFLVIFSAIFAVPFSMLMRQIFLLLTGSSI